MKVTQIQKGPSAHKIAQFLVILIIVTSCALSKKNRDIDLLQKWISNYKDALQTDSIFLNLGNHNGVTLEIIERRYEEEPKELKGVFTKENLDYFKKQVTDENSVWQIDLTDLDYAFLARDYPNKSLPINLAKPIYTVDGKYAFMLKYHDGGFFSAVKVYKKHNRSWEKVTELTFYKTYEELNNNIDE